MFLVAFFPSLTCRLIQKQQWLLTDPKAFLIDWWCHWTALSFAAYVVIDRPTAFYDTPLIIFVMRVKSSSPITKASWEADKEGMLLY